jgi:MFS family permease
MTEAVAQDTGGGFPAPRYAWSVVAILCVVTTCAYLDRQLIYLFVEPMRRTIGLSDTQLGLIQGLAFAFFFSILGVPLGRLVDRHNRRNLIVMGVLVWSMMTMLSGFADGFWSLFAARAGVGAGEAILAPAAFSLLADTFESRMRGRAIAVVALSGTLGSGASFLIGGLILKAVPGDALVHLPLLGDRFGWQIAFLAAGAPGLLIATLMLAIREPDRKERAHPEMSGAGSGLLRAYLREHGRLLLGLILVGSLLMMVAYGIAGWMAAYFIRRFALDPSNVGFALAALSVGAALLGGLGGGAVSDFLGQRRVGGRFDIYPICALIALPLVATWTLAPLPIFGFLLVMMILAATNLAACTTPTVLQEIAPNELRGFVLASYYVVQGILGPGLGPISIALVTDHVLGDPAAIGLSIPIATVPLVLLAFALSLPLRRAYSESRAAILHIRVGADQPGRTPRNGAV